MKYDVHPGDKFGNFTVIEKVKVNTKGGNVEWRWKCEDENKNIYHMRARALYQKAEKMQIEIEKVQNSEYYEKMGLNQMGLRKKYLGNTSAMLPIEVSL